MVLAKGWSADMPKHSKWRNSDSPCFSDHNEYSDPLQIAASAGARLSTPEKANISRKKSAD